MKTLDFSIKDTDAWQWRPAVGTDIQDMLDLSIGHFKDECAGLLVPDAHRGAKLLTEAVINQLYYPLTEFVIVARDKETGRVVAWAWAKRNCMMEFSSEETTELRIIHIDQSLAARHKIGLVGQLITIWWQWAVQCGIPVMVSATLRSEQSAFLRVLDAIGFSVRGSYAFYRTDTAAPVVEPEPEAPKIYTGTDR